MKLPGTPLQVHSLTRHAGGGRHPRAAGMDTGLRRYDGSFMPILHPDRSCTSIFKERTKRAKVRKSKFPDFVLFVFSWGNRISHFCSEAIFWQT
jgi:hypothetical protein